MKKNYMFLVLLVMSGFVFSQSQRIGNDTFSVANDKQHFNNQKSSDKAVLDSIQGIVSRINNTAVYSEKSDPSVEITLGAIGTTTVEVSFTPNETCASYWIYISTAADMTMWSGMFGSPDAVVHQWGIEKTGDYTHLWQSLASGTEYTIYVSPYNDLGVFFPLQTIVFSTTSGGGTGLAEIDVQVSEITTTSVRLIATPNDQTAVFHDGLITVAYYNEIGAEAAEDYFKNDNNPQYETENWTWGGLEPETAYYAIGIGQNSESEWGPASLVEFTTLSVVGIFDDDTQQSEMSLFPNPCYGTFTSISLAENNGKISIYNLNGQIVHEQNVNSPESRINVSGLANGTYYVTFTSKISSRVITQTLIITK